MNKPRIALLLLATVLSNASFAEGFYGSVKIQSVQQDLANSLLTSPRVSHRVASPDSNKDVGGSLALGFGTKDHWRLETENSITKDSNVKST